MVKGKILLLILKTAIKKIIKSGIYFEEIMISAILIF